ncbi:hypothetical protein V8E55_011799 [Tylopilus felleus]
MRDNSLKKDVFNRIAGELNGKFPSQRVPKTGKSCSTKWSMIWSKIKAEYTLISEIRSASGFYYDDSKGALVDDYTRAAWSIFCKSHPGASKYENNTWPYWNDVALLVPNIAKGTHVLHLGQAKSKQGQKKSTSPTDLDTIAAPPTPFTAVRCDDKHQPEAENSKYHRLSCCITNIETIPSSVCHCATQG